MEYRKFKALGISVDEGVLLNKFLVAIYKAEEENVIKLKGLFDEYNYNLSVVPGEFLKIFTRTGQEITETEAVLAKINELGLTTEFNANLKPSHFKLEFLNQYLKENNTNTFFNELPEESKFIYMDIMTTLNQIAKQYEMDPEIGLEVVEVIRNIKNRIVEPLKDNLYLTTSINDIINDIMFIGLDINEVFKQKMVEIINSAFNDERKITR